MARQRHPGEIEHSPAKGCAYGMFVVVILALILAVVVVIVTFDAFGSAVYD